MINIFAIIICTIFYWVLGALWFSPFLFGKIWSKALGKNPDDLGPNLKQVLGSFIVNLVATVMIAILLELIGSYNVLTGLLVGLLIGVGFVFTVDFYDVIFEQKSIIAYLIDSGYHAISFIIIGIILGLWVI